jgi:hypothetical protein
LHEASRKGKLRAIKALLERNADTNIINRYGHSAHDVATMREVRSLIPYSTMSTPTKQARKRSPESPSSQPEKRVKTDIDELELSLIPRDSLQTLEFSLDYDTPSSQLSPLRYRQNRDSYKQQKFRSQTEKMFTNKCFVTGHDLYEAAHIKPHSIDQNFEPDNCLLLTNGLHDEFDRYRCTVKRDDEKKVLKLIMGPAMKKSFWSKVINDHHVLLSESGHMARKLYETINAAYLLDHNVEFYQRNAELNEL